MATLHQPPPGYADLLGDAGVEEGDGVEVDGVGFVRAKKPNAKAIAALGAAMNAKIDNMARVGYQNLFVINAVGDEEFERLLAGILVGDFPSDTIMRVIEELATWGTARPTVPSSR